MPALPIELEDEGASREDFGDMKYLDEKGNEVAEFGKPDDMIEPSERSDVFGSAVNKLSTNLEVIILQPLHAWNRTIKIIIFSCLRAG